jgi:hypothetical protein
MPSGFIEIVVRRRTRGRRSRRRVLRVTSRQGWQLEVGDRVPLQLVVAVSRALGKVTRC